MGRKLTTNATKILTLLARPDYTLQRREGCKFYVVDSDFFIVHLAQNRTIKSLVNKGYIEATKTDDREQPITYEITENGKSFAQFIEEGR